MRTADRIVGLQWQIHGRRCVACRVCGPNLMTVEEWAEKKKAGEDVPKPDFRACASSLLQVSALPYSLRVSPGASISHCLYHQALVSVCVVNKSQSMHVSPGASLSHCLCHQALVSACAVNKPWSLPVSAGPSLSLCLHHQALVSACVINRP